MYVIILPTRMYITGGVYRRDSNEGNAYHILSSPLPDELRKKVYNLAINTKHGKRVQVPSWKAGRTIPCQELREKLPEVLEFQRALSHHISDIVGEQVIPTSLSYPTTASVLVYEKENDFINWHYDSNHYKGRFFTVIIPITLNPSCTDFAMRIDGQTVRAGLTLNGNDPKAIIFEGERLFHMATKLCDEEPRVVLSYQYVTSNDIDETKLAYLKIKDSSAYTGISSKDIQLWIVRVLMLWLYLCLALYVFAFKKNKYDNVIMMIIIITILISVHSKQIFLSLIHPNLSIVFYALFIINICVILQRNIWK